MAKKNSAAKEAEAQEKARREAIRDYNLQNAGSSWIDPDRTPTDEDVAMAKKDFEDAVTAINSKKYLIADSANAVRVATFLKNFVENGFWTQRSYVGVINFSALMTDCLKDFEENGTKDFELDYGPMQFAYLMLENYAGFGIEGARKMAEMWDEYIPIYDTLRDHVEYYEKEIHRIEALKSRWGMFAQGFYFVILDSDPITDSNAEPVESPEDAPTDETKVSEI